MFLALNFKRKISSVSILPFDRNFYDVNNKFYNLKVIKIILIIPLVDPNF